MKAILFTILLATPLLAGAKPVKEYYWALATEVEKGPGRALSTSMILGTRVVDLEAKTIVDEQRTLSRRGTVSVVKYGFDLAKKVVAIDSDGKNIGDGIVRSYKVVNGTVNELEYSLTTRGEGAYSYDGRDRQLKEKFPKSVVNEETGTVTIGNEKYAYNVIYYPLNEEQHQNLYPRFESAK